MRLRYLFVMLIIIFFQTSVDASECLAVFPSSFNQANTADEQLSNFPANNSASYLSDGTTLPRGDNYYLGSTLGNKDEVYVGGVSGSETTARLFFRGSVSWQNVKINESGNPEDLIIVVDGSLSITGGQTVINAIIYVKGAITVNGAASLTGAIAAVGSGSASVNYDESYINNADFNGMCAAASPATIDHYQIIHEGTALTCESETVTVRACTNAFDGTCTLSTDAVTLNLVTTGSSVVTNALSFTGSTTANIVYTTAESVTLSLASQSISPANNNVCNDNSAGSCSLEFADAGFRFLNGASGTSETISNQTSGDDISIRLQALYSNNGVCEGLFTGNVDIDLSQENKTPDDSNPGLSFQVNTDTDIDKYPDFTSNVTLNFGSDSIASIPNAKYLDAGQIQLHASYSESGVNLVGSSATFWVQPSYFQIDVVSCKDESDGCKAESTTTPIAGDTFSFTVTAYNSTANITENYRQSDGQLQLKLSNVLPGTEESVNGRFTYADGQSRLTSSSSLFSDVTLTDFYSGTFGVSTFSSAKYNEVGVINVDIQDIDYGDQGLLIEAQDVDIGRFIPAYFEQTIFVDEENEINDNGSLSVDDGVACAAEEWAYSGQTIETLGSDVGVIEYGAPPKLTITAMNADGEITENYIDDFVKLKASDIMLTAPSSDGNGFALTSDVSSEGTLAPFAGGVATYTLSDAHHFTYTRNSASKVAPFSADFTINIASIEDSDLVTTTYDGVNYIQAPLFSATTPNDTTTVDNSITIKFGRWNIDNAFGPETDELAIPMKVQYWDGTKFITNTDDSCIVPSVASKVTSNAIWSGGLDTWDYRLLDQSVDDSIEPSHTSASVSEMFDDGKFEYFMLSSPMDGDDFTQGTLQFEYEVPSWLKYDWQGDDDGTYDDNPTGLITFGVFRGSDRIISWREVGN